MRKGVRVCEKGCLSVCVQDYLISYGYFVTEIAVTE